MRQQHRAGHQDLRCIDSSTVIIRREQSEPRLDRPGHRVYRSGSLPASIDSCSATALAIASIAAVIAQVNEISATISAAVEEQNATTAEIARNVQQAASATEGVTGNIGKVSEAAEQTGAAGAEVLGAAQELSEKSEQMRREIETFLTDIRAA